MVSSVAPHNLHKEETGKLKKFYFSLHLLIALVHGQPLEILQFPWEGYPASTNTTAILYQLHLQPVGKTDHAVICSATPPKAF